MSDRGLTPKQAAFVREYLVDRNATQAAIRAGYSAKTAYSIGQRLLKHVEIEREITAVEAERVKDVKVTKEWILTEAQATYRQARQLNQPGAARSALDLLARMGGHITEKRETRIIRTLEDLSDEELAAVEADAERRERDSATQH